uniref:G8 domain-containing protein n=1 Tax=Xiphophorus couchianus TaxID=32473 RepID=A0A3B5MVU8_9TELE
RILWVSPHTGSTAGATRLTISGDGFAQEHQVQLDPEDGRFGNRVTLVSDALSVPCDVERDSTHHQQILCYTRAMPEDQYVVHVSVDGVPIPDNNICNGNYKPYHCSLYTRWWRTPTIYSLNPVTGLPGTLVTIRGRIYSDVYGSNTDLSSSGLNVRFLRSYMGGMPCELLKPILDYGRKIPPYSIRAESDIQSRPEHIYVSISLCSMAILSDFAPLNFEVFDSDTNVSVSEITKGQSNMAAFTLSWAGLPAAPVTFNATASEVQSVLEDLMKADCPAEVLTTQGSNVKYFNDFEDPGVNLLTGTPEGHSGFCGFWSLKNADALFRETFTKESGGQYGPVSLDQHPTLCFAYKGRLRDEMGVKFIYSDSSGQTQTQTSRISTLFSSGDRWSYKCVDLQSVLQTAVDGSRFLLQELLLYRDAYAADYYVDAVHIGKTPTAVDENLVTHFISCRFPASIQSFSVTKHQPTASQVTYRIVATPLDCAFDFPLMEISFMQMSNSSEDVTEFVSGGATVTVTRPHRATPPLSGTFDVEMYSGRAEGLPVDVSAEDLKFALQGVPGVGQVKVEDLGTCRLPEWRVTWLTRPGAQPLMKVDDSAVVGNNVNFVVREKAKGGLLTLGLTGDFFRVWEAEPQVEVYINGIPSNCSGRCSFRWSEEETPVVTGISPTQGSDGLGTLITITGTGFSSENASIMVGSSRCVIEEVTASSQVCRVGGASAGSYPVSVNFPSLGDARFAADLVLYFTQLLIVSSLSPTSGGVAGVWHLTVAHLELQRLHSASDFLPRRHPSDGERLRPRTRPHGPSGAVITLSGSGFGSDPELVSVTIDGVSCNVSAISDSQLRCMTGSKPGGTYPVVLHHGVKGHAQSAVEFTYELTLNGMQPNEGSFGGGALLSVFGSGFDPTGSRVLICDRDCPVLRGASSSSRLFCLSPPNNGSDPAVGCHVSVLNLLDAVNVSQGFTYRAALTPVVSQVSPRRGGTAGGTRLTISGSGQTVLLDASTPVLKMLLIQGGTLMFDEADLELQAENILITDGGRLQIGQEGAPFQHKAIITLHGHLRSPELPVYGSKTLAVREGVLDLHGIPVSVTWTHLAQTAANGSATLTLMEAVTWKPGEEIVIASTGHRHSQSENEVRTIAAVSAGGKTLTLAEPLTFSHLGVSATLPDGAVFEARAEVGLLTRNIVVRGSQNLDWTDRVDACPDGFNTGEFATQTCFQGRFGEEIGSDQFGGCIMFHVPRPGENLALGRLEYVEIFHAGQAFRLGRYPIHWHLMGDINFKSYVRGCAIHQTFNRAVTIHNTHRLLVEHNVIYDIMGGAFFIEDGIETENILQYNLAVFVKQSTSLLNDDVTPAAYWVTNPNNIIRHNAAAGGTHFGFWYRMHNNPDGPSYDPNICQKRVPLGEFSNNTVHSQGWFGLWIFQEFFPMKDGRCTSTTPEPAVFHSLTTWNCEKGAEWVNVGAVQFNNFIMVNNEKAGVEAKRIFPWAVSGFGEDGGATVSNSTIVAHVDELGLGSDYCTRRGVITPFDDGMSVLNTQFVNFNRSNCTAIGVTSIDGTCTDRCGGWAVRFAGIQYRNSPNKAGFRWEHEVQLVDTDGSLTGNVDHKVVPMSSLLDPAHCSHSAEWSVGFPGAVCDHTVNFHRLAFNNPTPTSLQAKDVILTNSHGSSVVPYLKKRMTHKLGWMALLPSGQTYNWHFDNADHITNISYDAKFYGFKSDQFVIIKHNFTQSPDSFHILDDRNGSSAALSFSGNDNGDWFFNKTTNDLFFLISGKTSRRRRHSSVDRSMTDVTTNLAVYRCFFHQCVAPAPATPAPVPSRRPNDFILWSDASFWKGSAENNFSVPADDADAVIPTGKWVVLDRDTPSLSRLTVSGVLEVLDSPNRTLVIDAVYVSIQGGRLLAGWDGEPFQGRLEIRLRGNHDSPDWLLPGGPNQGSKVLGVFGTLDLYGRPPGVYRTKLAATAAAGSNSLVLMQPVDWKVGDQVAVSTSGYRASETEKRRIAAVSADGLVLTLNHPLDHTHMGETHSIPGSSFSYTLAADVGLLSRNIRIIGEEYPAMMVESFGARLLVGTFSSGGVSYRGKAQIRNVEFFRSGQEGWTDYYDPRYSVAFHNLGEGCAFHDGFSPAIGVFGTAGLSIDDNVVHHTVGEGIRVWGDRIMLRRNLVMMSLWPGSYQDREEPFNFQWNAAIEVSEGSGVVLQNNIVAGYERVAYRIDGEPCPGFQNPNEAWVQNEAHGGLYGVYLNKDGLAGCSFIRGFFVWKAFDFAIYFQVIMDVVVSNVTLVDNGMGIMPLVFAPPSLSHAYADKSVLVQNSLIVGSSPAFNCSDTLSSDNFNVVAMSPHRAPRPPQGGRSGICWPTFQSEHNTAPAKPHHLNMNYNAIKGLMTVTDTTLVGFRDVCSGERNLVFMTNPLNEDLQHPLQVSAVRTLDSTEDARVFIHRPDVSKANPADCVDMDCDAKKKSLLKDLDGSFLGAVGSVVPQSEFEWGGDPRRGLGDYRIPKVMLTFLNGSRIPVVQVAPRKGVIRKNCTYMSSWQSYKCFGLNHRMVAIESLDSDTETRRLSPVAVLGDGFVDLINGPQDHGWCAGYTCQRRVSLFHSIMATGHAFDVYFTSVSPQKLRLLMLNSDPSESVLVSVFYSNPQRLDVYVENRLVAPSNAVWNDDGSDYILREPAFRGEFVPQMNASMGTNFFDRDYKMLKVLLRGSGPLEIRTAPVLILAFNMPALTDNQFFGDSLVQNLAQFLRIPANMIRVSRVVSESGGARRRKRSAGLTVEVEIRKPPVQQSADGTAGQWNDVCGTVREPQPPGGSDRPGRRQQFTEDVSREEPKASYLSSVSRLLLIRDPVAGEAVGPLLQQPVLMAVDNQGNCVSVGVTSLTVTASMKNASGDPVGGLDGNATIRFSSCWANFSDLSILTSGENLTMVFTLKDWSAQSRSFSVVDVPPSTTTEGPTRPTEGPTRPTTEDDSVFSSGSVVSAGGLCLISIIYEVACCSTSLPLC